MKITLFLAALMLLCSGCNEDKSAALRGVENFRIDDYMGTWYEIARTPNFFERGLSDVKAVYTKRPDGKISVVNSGIKKSGKKVYITGSARPRSGRDSRGELEVSFFPPFYSPYLVLATDYTSFAIVSGKNTEYLWILAREPHLTHSQTDRILAIMKELGIPDKNLFFH